MKTIDEAIAHYEKVYGEMMALCKTLRSEMDNEVKTRLERKVKSYRHAVFYKKAMDAKIIVVNLKECRAM